MKNINFLMALAVVCILVTPAFSMPIDGMAQDGKQKTCDCQCDGQKLKMEQDGKQMWPGLDDGQKTCGCQHSMMNQDDTKMWQGQDDGQKTCGCQHSMMNQDDTKMWQGQDDKQKTDSCPKSMMNQDDMKMWQGHGDDQKTCGCQKSMMDQDGGQKMCQGQGGAHIKSMMGPDGDHMGHDHIKSMMGDRERGDNGSIKIVIVNVHV